MTGRVHIRDHVLWIKHVDGDDALSGCLSALSSGDRIELFVDGHAGIWEKMADGRNVPTPGLKPLGEAKTYWHELQRRRGEWVSIGSNMITGLVDADMGPTNAPEQAHERITIHSKSASALVIDTPERTAADPIDLPSIVAHADWSLGPAKRFVAEAVLTENGYLIDAPRPVGPVLGCVSDLLARAAGGSVLFGVDCPIGVPRAWADRAGVADFASLLPKLGHGRWDRFFDVCESADEIGIERPFYPARPGGTSRSHLMKGLGFGDPRALNRRCDHATANRPRAEALFWTLGGKQVGKAALTFWREMLIAAWQAKLPIRLWPFEGALATLLTPGHLVVAETYPGEVYHHLGVRFRQVKTEGKFGKRQQGDRAANAAVFVDWAAAMGVRLSESLSADLENGFGNKADGEDRFDAVVGVCGMLNVCLGRRPSGEPTNDPSLSVEGWILGQAATSGRAGRPSGASP